MLAAARRGASASPHGPGMHPHTLLSRMPMRSVDAVVVLQLCSAATAPVSRVAAVGPAPLPPAPPPADAVVRALFGSRPRGGGSSVGPGRAARLEDGTPTRVPILSFCSFLPVSRLCRETAECVPS